MTLMTGFVEVEMHNTVIAVLIIVSVFCLVELSVISNKMLRDLEEVDRDRLKGMLSPDKD